MKILVTGGAGFVGSNLCEALAKDPNNEVYSLDNYFTGSRDNHIEGVNGIYHYIVGAIYAIWVVHNGYAVGQSAQIDGTVIVEAVGEKQRHTAHKTLVA